MKFLLIFSLIAIEKSQLFIKGFLVEEITPIDSTPLLLLVILFLTKMGTILALRSFMRTVHLMQRTNLVLIDNKAIRKD